LFYPLVLVRELAQQGRGDWQVIAVDAEVDPITHINFDYELRFEDKLIALEVFRLVESKQEIERSKSWGLISNKIAEELVSRGVKGYTIRTPYFFDVPKAKVDPPVAHTHRVKGEPFRLTHASNAVEGT